MDNVKKWLNKKGYKFEVLKMQDSSNNIFIDLNSISDYHIINKYIYKYTDLKTEFRGNYTVLRVY